MFLPPAAEIAASAPPEIGAAILLRLGSDSKLPKSERIQLYDDAYELAARAKTQYRFASATLNASSDSLAGKMIEAGQTRLDSISLQASVIRATMSVDPAHALDLARRMPMPSIAPLTCKDFAVPLADEFYNVAEMIALRGFSNEDRAKGKPLQYLTSIFSASASPQLLLSAVRLLTRYKASDEDIASLTGTLAGAFRGAPADPLAYLGVPALELELRTLVLRLGASGITAVPLLDGYRFFIVRQLNSELCPAVPERLGVDYFNFALRTAANVEADIPAIDAKELKPRHSDAKDANTVFWDANDSKKILGMVNSLSRAEKDGLFDERFQDALHLISVWQGHDGISSRAFFHQKAVAYSALLGTTAKESQLRAVLSSFVQFLRDAPERNEYPAEWFAYIQRLAQPWAPAGMTSVKIASEEVRRSGDALMAFLLDPASFTVSAPVAY